MFSKYPSFSMSKRAPSSRNPLIPPGPKVKTVGFQGAEPSILLKLKLTLCSQNGKKRILEIKKHNSKKMSLGQITNPWTKISNLMIAAANGAIPRMTEYFQSPLDVDQQDADGNTALLYAVNNNQIEAASILLDNGANPNLANKGGATPLAYALQHGNGELATMLIEAGAELDLPELSPKEIGIEAGHQALVNELENIPSIDLAQCQNDTDFATMEPLRPKGTISIEWRGQTTCYDIRALRESIRSQGSGIYGVLGNKPNETFIDVYSVYPLNYYIDIASGLSILTTPNRRYRANILLEQLRINQVDQPVYSLTPI